MRKQFIETESRKVAKNECPWACKVVKVDGSFYCFESETDYKNWKKQA